MQLVVSTRDDAFLDAQGFAPVGEVIEGLAVLDNLWRSFGNAPPRGRGRDQGRIFAEGKAYLAREFPHLDRVTTARVVPPPAPANSRQ
jgi:hypothetical protein